MGIFPDNTLLQLLDIITSILMQKALWQNEIKKAKSKNENRKTKGKIQKSTNKFLDKIEKRKSKVENRKTKIEIFFRDSEPVDFFCQREF